MAFLSGSSCLNRWPARLLPGLLALALAACGGQDNSSASFSASSGPIKTLAGTTAQAALPLYSVVPIAPEGYPEEMNAAGQVIFNRYIEGSGHAYFYNGTRVIELPFPAGVQTVTAYRLNAAGQVLGFVFNLDRTSYSFLWSEATGMVMTTGLMGSNSSAVALNDGGQLSGTTAGATDPGDFTPRRRGTFWSQQDGIVDMGTLGGKWVAVKDMNNNGQVVGEATLSGDTGPTRDGYARAFIWSKSGGMINLQNITTPNLTDSQATYISENGQVIGSLYLRGQGGLYAWGFYWSQANGMVPLTTLGGPSSSAKGINNAGQVIGSRENDNGFVWTKASGMTTIPGLEGGQSGPKDINDAGQVVGASSTASGELHAITWTKASGTVDLNTRLKNAPAGLVVTDAYKISKDGIILANSNNGLVLLKPGVESAAAPVAGPLVSNDAVAIGAALEISGSFTDADVGDTHTASVSWGDGSAPQSAVMSENSGSGTVSASHVYTAPGIYTITLKVTDNTGRNAESTREIVVFDPAAGILGGQGWFASPKGAIQANPNATGRATFRFASLYQPGAATPSTSLKFKVVGDKFIFEASNADWLTITDDRAQYQGTGSLNGVSGYTYRVTAINAKSKTRDRLRIQIWHYDATKKADVLDYDNQGSSGEGSIIGGGNIVIRK